MVPRERLVAWLNAIRWGSPESITPDAQRLIDEHRRRLRIVIRELSAKRGITPLEAESAATTPGYDTVEYASVLDDLFDGVTFENAGVREPLIIAISAAYCWHLDPELATFPNPYAPLLDLCGMGYTPSVDFDPDGEGDWIFLVVGFNGRLQKYRIV